MQGWFNIRKAVCVTYNMEKRISLTSYNHLKDVEEDWEKNLTSIPD